MTSELKDSLKTRKKISSVITKKQSFENNSSGFSKSMKLLSFPNDKGLCYSLDKNLFQLEQKLVYFDFALKEIKDIIKSA